MRIAIVDDEQAWLMQLAQTIRKFPHWCGQRLIIEPYIAAQSFVDAVEQGAQYNFIFLDIHIPDVDGISAFHKISKYAQVPVIFVSTHVEKLPDIYKLYPAAFLIKPYTQESFDKTVSAVLSQVKADTAIYQYKSNGSTTAVKLCDIYCFLVVGHETSMRTTRGYVALPRKPLNIIEDELKDSGFFRCHNAFLINLRYYHDRTAKEVLMDFGGKIEALQLSKHKKDELDRACINYKAETENAF